MPSVNNILLQTNPIINKLQVFRRLLITSANIRSYADVRDNRVRMVMALYMHLRNDNMLTAFDLTTRHYAASVTSL
jgi:hypothetical protein